MTLFKVGDTVRVKEDAGTAPYSGNFVSPEMARFRGKTYKIENVYDNLVFCYRLDGSGWVWREEWLEPAELASINVTSDDLMELLDG